MLTANSDSSYVFFLYEEGGIQWTTSTPPTVGLNAGDGETFASVTGTNTPNVINIDSTTNIGIPGMWAFQVNAAQVTGRPHIGRVSRKS